MRNTLIATNPGEDCAGDGPIEAINGVTDDASCPGSSFADARLGGLANNTGPTDTHALLTGSPAIDTGGSCPPTDQRGVSRPQGAGCDVGAFEGVVSSPPSGSGGGRRRRDGAASICGRSGGAAAAGGGRGGQRGAQERHGEGQGRGVRPVRRARGGPADPGRLRGRHHQGPRDDRGGGRAVRGLLRRHLPPHPGQGSEAAHHADPGREAQLPEGRQAIAAAKKKKRRLWGDGSGKFRTKGKHSAATVVGTKWLVEDKCTRP